MLFLPNVIILIVLEVKKEKYLYISDSDPLFSS